MKKHITHSENDDPWTNHQSMKQHVINAENKQSIGGNIQSMENQRSMITWTIHGEEQIIKGTPYSPWKNKWPMEQSIINENIYNQRKQKQIVKGTRIYSPRKNQMAHGKINYPWNTYNQWRKHRLINGKTIQPMTNPMVHETNQ